MYYEYDLVVRDKAKMYTKSEDDGTVRKRVMTFLVPIRYVISLYDVTLTFDLLTLNGYLEFLVTCSNHTPTSSILQLSDLEL